MINSEELDLIEKINTNWRKTHGDFRSAVLISHLCIEHAMTKIIEKKFANPKALDKLHFSVKLKILDGMKVMDQKSINNIRILNQIRNDFVHVLDVDSKEFESEFMKKIRTLSSYKTLEKMNLQYPENYFSFAVSFLLKSLISARDEPTSELSTESNP